MTITKENIANFVELATIHEANNCLEIILEFYRNNISHGQDFIIDYSMIVAKILTFYAVTHSKQQHKRDKAQVLAKKLFEDKILP